MALAHGSDKLQGEYFETFYGVCHEGMLVKRHCTKRSIWQIYFSQPLFVQQYYINGENVALKESEKQNVGRIDLTRIILPVLH